MKGFVAVSTIPSVKRRCRAPASAVFVLVLFSLFVPLAFLLGLHNRFPSAFYAFCYFVQVMIPCLRKILDTIDPNYVPDVADSLDSLSIGKLIGYCFENLSVEGHLGSSACTTSSSIRITFKFEYKAHCPLQFQTKNEVSLRAAALPASLLTFRNLVYPLGERWSLPGLGHSYGVNADSMKSSVSLHYNGDMKPWLDLGVPKYKIYWKKFLTQDEKFMDECNVNP
ncbi:hypothetical protein BHE74_00025238 [Ensete ventricosum]|nr:hypothetical protein GW17_00029564 [Ensete ventricosum]RWW67325.1 hypothetical protein BHE74_00025238 [Ensete ventricosum]